MNRGSAVAAGGGRVAARAPDKVPVASPAAAGRGRVEVAVAPVGMPGTLEEWVDWAFDRVGEEHGQEEVLAGVQGRERAFFEEVLGRAAKEGRDVGVAVRSAALGLVLAEGTGGAAVVVREVWARACCMRRSFLAAGLEGMAEGLALLDSAPVVDGASAGALLELSSNADPLVADAAAGVLCYFWPEQTD